MNQQKFLERCVKQGLTDGIRIKVYFSLDDNDNVILNEEDMREEFDLKIRELNEILD